MSSSFNDLAELIRRRRTSMAVDPLRPVEAELVAELCELAQWAPNHKRTWPWRFALFLDEGRRELGATVADAMAARGDEPDRVEKARIKYLRTPAVLVVGSAAGDSPLRTTENRDAVAAAIQNFLLAATAVGMATYWGSCPKGANEPVAMLSGFAPETSVVAMIYLGWAAGEQIAPERPAVRLTVVGG